MEPRPLPFAALLLVLGACAADRSDSTAAPSASDAPGRAAPEAPPARHSAVVPAPRPDPWWRERHEAQLARVREGGADLVFLGDSITQGWESEGRDVWREHYGGRAAVNLGISGDRTQHVLWRLDDGVLDALAAAARPPRLAVVMIGTNNSNGEDNTAEEIAEGITAIVQRLRERLPSTRVLLLAIFPRGERPDSQREKNALASRRAAERVEGEGVRVLDIGERFLEPGGTLPREVMPDLLHLSPRGYAIWAEAIEPEVARALGPRR